MDKFTAEQKRIYFSMASNIYKAENSLRELLCYYGLDVNETYLRSFRERVAKILSDGYRNLSFEQHQDNIKRLGDIYQEFSDYWGKYHDKIYP